MFRIAFIVIACLAIALGVTVGVLNPLPVQVDLLWLQWQWPLGLTLIAAMAVGLLLGLLLNALLVSLPLHLRLRSLQRQAGAETGTGPESHA